MSYKYTEIVKKNNRFEIEKEKLLKFINQAKVTHL